MERRQKILVAGGTGHLGQLIVKYLLALGATPKVLTRTSRADEAIRTFRDQRVEIVEADYDNPLSLVDACMGVTCVVSALSGLGDVIVDAQTKLLRAAIEAKVSRFIPSDFCIDYRPLKPGSNRNLDYRREFSKILDSSKIKTTSILNGMFMDLLVDQAPVILKKQKRIFFWGNPDQEMDFTTMDNTAEYTAYAALDDDAPRWLLIAGETASMRDLQGIASNVWREKFKLFRPGGLKAFKILIQVTKTFAPGKHETFPAWQGMQYLYDMLSGLPKFNHLHNNRYKKIRWTKISEVVAHE